MNSTYPLFPELPEEGQKEAQELIDKFKASLLKSAEDAIMSLYTDITPYIESDSWGNFRSQIMNGFKNYENRKIQNEYNFAEIRKEIYKEFKSDLIPDMNQDILKENEDLKKQILHLSDLLRIANSHY